MFFGPQETPFICETESFTLDANCLIATRVDLDAIALNASADLLYK